MVHMWFSELSSGLALDVFRGSLQVERGEHLLPWRQERERCNGVFRSDVSNSVLT